MKRCVQCGKDKQQDEFYRHPRSRHGRQGTCIECRYLRERARYQDASVRARRRAYQLAYSRERRQDPAFRQKERDRERAENLSPEQRDRRSAQRSARAYGIPVSEVSRLRSLAKCECCGCDTPSDSRDRHIDHCHETGKVRGMVCRDCNHTMRGRWRECVDRMRKCIDYLTRHHKEDEC